MQDSLHTLNQPTHIFLMNMYDKYPFHPLYMGLLSPSSPCLMTELLNQGLQNDFTENILHAITWMLLCMTGGKWGL